MIRFFDLLVVFFLALCTGMGLGNLNSSNKAVNTCEAIYTDWYKKLDVKNVDETKLNNFCIEFVKEVK